MSKEFSLTEFATFLGGLTFEMDEANRIALERAARLVETEAKHVLGTYEYGWPQLAPSTQAQRVQQGYPANEPGLRSGDMRDSITHVADHKEAQVGSNDQHLVWFELGTVKQPPRPVLQGALVHKTDEVLEIIGRQVVGALAGESVVGANEMIPLP